MESQFDEYELRGGRCARTQFILYKSLFLDGRNLPPKSFHSSSSCSCFTVSSRHILLSDTLACLHVCCFPGNRKQRRRWDSGSACFPVTSHPTSDVMSRRLTTVPLLTDTLENIAEIKQHKENLNRPPPPPSSFLSSPHISEMWSEPSPALTAPPGALGHSTLGQL